MKELIFDKPSIEHSSVDRRRQNDDYEDYSLTVKMQRHIVKHIVTYSDIFQVVFQTNTLNYITHTENTRTENIHLMLLYWNTRNRMVI